MEQIDFDHPTLNDITETIEELNDIYYKVILGRNDILGKLPAVEMEFMRGNCYAYAVLLHTIFPDSFFATGSITSKDPRLYFPSTNQDASDINHVVTFIKVREHEDYFPFDALGYNPCIQDYPNIKADELSLLGLDSLKNNLDLERKITTMMTMFYQRHGIEPSASGLRLQ